VAHRQWQLRFALPMDSVLGAQATDRRQDFMKARFGDNNDRIQFHDDRGRGWRIDGRGENRDAGQVALPEPARFPLAHPTMAEELGFLFPNVPLRSAQ
jgi:hypothetical protein